MTEIQDVLQERTIDINGRSRTVTVLDQRVLPHQVTRLSIGNYRQGCEAIRNMTVRGAPLIGVTGAATLALASTESTETEALREAAEAIKASRPTAVNLSWAVDRMLQHLLQCEKSERCEYAWSLAQQIYCLEREMSERIARCALEIIRALYRKVGRPVRLLTHCNAGALATVDLGTATAGFYAAHASGIPIEVFADETRPRLQGVMTAWELKRFGIDVTLIADNTGGYLMQQGKVDAVFVGADRIASNGDTANKIGTYLKALSARAHNVPFYVAAPLSTFDWNISDGSQIPIEEREGEEVRCVSGVDPEGVFRSVRITEEDQKVLNPAFDITPAELITGFVTDQGLVGPAELFALKKEM